MTHSPKEYRQAGDGFILWCNENVRIPVYPEGSDIPVWMPMSELPKNENPKTGRSFHGMWLQQQEIAREALQMEGGRFVHRLIVFCWPRGDGKCQEKGSKILMYDGTLKKVEDVEVGDLLMGDDNTPRKVLSLASGKEEMFEVVPTRGKPMVVTADHVLSLKRRQSRRHKRGKPFFDKHVGTVIDMTVSDYIKQNANFKNLHLLYSVPVDWDEQEVPIDPYFLGLWLGDGNADRPSITTMDKEVVDFLYDYANSLRLDISVKTKPDNKASSYNLVGTERTEDNIHRLNPLLNLIRKYNLSNNKHIPQIYKANSRRVRLQLLAGLVDSDGCVNRNSVDITLKSKNLIEDVGFLARSLGFHVTIYPCTKTIKSLGFSGEYYRIGISGDCSIIPVKISRKRCRIRSNWKNVLVTGIKKIQPVGEREYYGFMLDGNGRYLTEHFMVTHNSLLACLIQLWKFFNWPRQQIVLGANSVSQIRFVHYEIMQDIIRNSPRLLARIGANNIQLKEIRLTDTRGSIRSMIRAISSYSGIVSNITGYTFSEMFDMKNPKFYVQLDGSTRNIPNALGVIDSTVSERSHVLHKLYEAYRNGKDPQLFFSYRYSEKGDANDFMNPNMTQEQLDSYRWKFPFGEFERYFKNLWSAGTEKVFTREMIEATNYLGIDGELGVQVVLLRVLEAKNRDLDAQSEVYGAYKDGARKSMVVRVEERAKRRTAELDKRLWPIETLYTLKDDSGMPKCATLADLERIGDLYKTDFAICVGLDLADPMKASTSARTIMTVLAKGLPGMRINPFPTDESEAPRYMYWMLHLVDVADHSLDTIKDILLNLQNEYDGIDVLGAERWGIGDMEQWCIQNEISPVIFYPTYGRQRSMFGELFLAYQQGRIKIPPLGVRGYKMDDILYEEASAFDHNPNATRSKFGSPQKKEKYGIQDDAMFSLGAAVYGSLALGVDKFRKRGRITQYGFFYEHGGHIGKW